MESKDIVLLIVVATALGFSLWRKFSKKNQGIFTPGHKPQSGSLFSSQSKDDDYEPYSNK